MNPPATEGQNSALFKAAEEILSCMILSARCQNKRQLLLRWFMPFKRTRSHFRRSLLARVQEVIAANVQGERDKDENERKRRSKISKKSVPQKFVHKDQLSSLNERLKALTHNLAQSFDSYYYGLDEAVPKSMHLADEEVEELGRWNQGR